MIFVHHALDFFPHNAKQEINMTLPYKDVYVNSFFPHTAKLWNSLPIECFPLNYDLHRFKSITNRDLLTVCSF